jgi:NAD(P)-dependent dehydrogenase (short-subunit alcohol dehydrogenase family)
MDRYGSTGEVAAAVMYFVGDEAGYTTGVDLPVDGGFLASGARRLA